MHSSTASVPAAAARRRLIVVGNGMVGQRFVEELTKRDTAGHWNVTVLGAEPVPAYDRVGLSSYFDGATLDDLLLDEPGGLAARGVDLRLGCRVIEIDRSSRAVQTADGDHLEYDLLVLATGSDPFVPPIPVVLMAATTAHEVARQLLDNGWSSETAVAFVHRAGTSEQRQVTGSLGDVRSGGCPLPSPSVMVVGPTVDRARSESAAFARPSAHVPSPSAI